MDATNAHILEDEKWKWADGSEFSASNHPFEDDPLAGCTVPELSSELRRIDIFYSLPLC